MGPMTTSEHLDCANEALRQERDDAREYADRMKSIMADVLQELNGMKETIQGRIDAIDEYLKQSPRCSG